MSNERLTLTVEELAQEFGISKPTAYELLKRDGFPSIRVTERRIVIPVEPLRRWLEENTENGGGIA